MMRTIHVKLADPEVGGLYKLAETECRPMRDQLRLIVREALQARGLIQVGDSVGTEQLPKEARSAAAR